MSEYRVGRNTSFSPFRTDYSDPEEYSWPEYFPGDNFWEKAVIRRVAQACYHEDYRSLRLHELPEIAAKFYDIKGWGPTLQTLLAGTRDENSPLHVLRKHESTLAKHIYHFVFPPWAWHVKLTIPAAFVGRSRIDSSLPLIRYNEGRIKEFKYDILIGHPNTSIGRHGFVAFAKCGKVEFPAPTDLNINMMPFIFGDKKSLPRKVREYYNLIEQCPYMQDDVGKVGYLTVQESFVEAGKSQRRPGIHIESPGIFKMSTEDSVTFTPAEELFTKCPVTSWGEGAFYGPDLYEGGIYFASSVDDSSEVWDALVDKSIPGIVHRYGDCEHLRGILGPETKLKAGELVWMTDCTPHEALILDEPVYRQFFRVVGPQISHWYAKHSTRNPLVPLPEHVIVVQGDKFATKSHEK